MYNLAPLHVQIRSFSHSVLLVALAFVIGAGLAIPGMLLVGLLGFSLSPPSLEVIVTNSILQYVGFFVVVWGYIAYTDSETLIRVRRPTLRDLIWTVTGLVGVFAAVSVASIVVSVIGADQAQNSVVSLGQENPDLFLLMIPITLLFVAPGEELLFRGVVLGLFRRSTGTVPAIVISSVMFGVVHYIALAGSGKLTYIGVTILLGLLLAGVYELTNNILVPIIVHGIYNAILFASQWAIAVNDIPLPS